MSDNKEMSIKLTQEEKERQDEQNKIILDAKAPAKTNILNTIKFNNKLDEEVFNLLPLSDKQKEELILSCEFNTDIETITDKNWDGRLSPTIPEGLNNDIECIGGCDIKKKKFI